MNQCEFFSNFQNIKLHYFNAFWLA